MELAWWTFKRGDSILAPHNTEYHGNGGIIPGQPSLKATLAKIIKSQAYQDLVDGDPEIPGTRIRALSLTTDRYRKAAKMVFLQEHPELHSLIGARQREVRGAVLKKQAQRGQPGAAASAILQALSP